MGRHSAADEQAADDEQSASRPRFLRRHRKVLIAVSVLLLVPLVAVAGYAFYLNSSLGNIERINIDLEEQGRPKDDPGESILLLGVDLGNEYGSTKRLKSASIAKDSRRPAWPAGKYNSDTIMILHISENKSDVSVVSIPRDSYVNVYDGNGKSIEKNRVNHALNKFGPSAAIETVEQLTNIRIDHLAMVDFNGFVAIADVLGGVEVYVPETTTYQGRVVWEKGNHTLKGEDALRYVRTRKDLPNSDYSRIRRQQNFFRAMMRKTLSIGTLANPVKLSGTVDGVTENLSLDEGWSNSNIRGLAFSMRGVSMGNVKFVTLPIEGYSHRIEDIGSVVTPDKQKVGELTKAIRSNRVDQFIEKYPKQGLGAETKVR